MSLKDHCEDTTEDSMWTVLYAGKKTINQIPRGYFKINSWAQFLDYPRALLNCSLRPVQFTFLSELCLRYWFTFKNVNFMFNSLPHMATAGLKRTDRKNPQVDGDTVGTLGGRDRTNPSSPILCANIGRGSIPDVLCTHPRYKHKRLG